MSNKATDPVVISPKQLAAVHLVMEVTPGKVTLMDGTVLAAVPASIYVVNQRYDLADSAEDGPTRLCTYMKATNA
jgi:hypothetical protein